MKSEKVLVISDTHGRLTNAEQVIERLIDKVSMVIHLGDMLSDARLLEAEYDGVEFCCVAGNCDFYYSAEDNLPLSKIIEINGVKLLLSHGHEEGVKRGYSHFAETARRNGVAVALCGHTHEPFIKTVEGILCVNPGSISYPRRNPMQPSYAVLNIPSDGSAPTAGIVEIRKPAGKSRLFR